MGRYASPADVITRYSGMKDYGDAVVDSAYIRFAEAELDELLGDCFTVPFSSNNITATDLAIELTYMKGANLKREDLDKRMEAFTKRIEALRKGTTQMYVESGDNLVSTGSTTAIPQSNTQDDFAVFGMSDMEDSYVDPDALDREAAQKD